MVIKSPIVLPEQKCFVLNYRKRYPEWETAIVSTCAFKMGNGNSYWHYTVILDRLSPKRLRIWLSVSDKSIRKIMKGS